METWIEREKIYEGRIVTLETGRVRLANGAEAPREVLRHPGAVAVAPLVDGHIVFVEQYRVAIEQTTIEIPAGKLEGAEDPVSRGLTELREETGLIATELIAAGTIYPSCGILDEKMYIYLALEMTQGEQDLDGDEDVTIVRLSIDEVRRRLAEHTFVDAKTIIGLHALLAYIGKN